MSFSGGGGQSHPWQRNNVFPQTGMFIHQTAQSPLTSFGGASNAIYPQGGTGNLGYPQARGSSLNPVAFQQQHQQPSAQQYNSVGTVTKISADCGLVNDEIFFYRNVCKGPTPKLGDRVLFEASYTVNGQFKWNATRIQLFAQAHQSQQPQPLMQNSTNKLSNNYSSVSGSNDYPRPQHARSPLRRSRSPGRDRLSRNERHRRERNHRSRDREEEELDRKRRREEPKRERHYSVERKEKERERVIPYRVPTKTHRTRAIRRYMVQIPKSLLPYKHADVQELRRRYTTMYIPSDFFHANVKWPDSFPAENSFSLRRPCQFHIMHKIVEPQIEQKMEDLEPADADYLYSAKVMLMACPPIAELYQKCFDEEDNDAENTMHPSRLISFLVGTRGRNEPMAIGGPWSPSLDGEHPDKDPAVLIRTAIRTCKALTGIDLSNCTQWYRFVEIHYHRSEYKHKEKEASPISRIETVVIFLPDVSSCMPTPAKWQELTDVYKSAVENVIARKNATLLKASNANNTTGGDDAANGAIATEDPSTLANNSESETTALNTTENSNIGEDDRCSNEAAVPSDSNEPAPVTSPDAVTSDSSLTPAPATGTETGTGTETTEGETKTKMESTADGDNENEKDIQPKLIHYSKLDLKSMKVQEIRDQLTARNLPTKGARNLLMARLAKALNIEKNQEIVNVESPADGSDSEVIDLDATSADIEAADEEENASKRQRMSDEKAIKSDKSQEIEELENWIDSMDVDLNDIVILDEYDASKNADDTPKELDEKEKNQLIRRYTLPSAPHIVVHPNKLAKGGKFDCSVMSLSVLLDYHPEDTKERFFEVSLFAELFNEMLMRDFGFTIYKELYLYKDDSVQPADSTEHKDEENHKKDEKPSNDEDEKPKEVAEHKPASGSGDSASERERRISKRSLEDDADEDAQSVKSKRRATKERDNHVDKKTVIVKPALLLSFVYFDSTHCGYIFEKDLEELFSILGLQLSRGQIRKVLGKLSTRQAIYYRKLTDKEESVDATPTIEDVSDISPEELKKIALGNRQFSFANGSNDHNIAQDKVVSLASTENEGLVNMNGTVVHVGKLIDQIKRTENSFSDLEKLYNDLRKQHSDLQKDHSRSSAKIKDLQSEVKSLHKKLNEADQSVFSLNRKYKEQNATLSYIYNRVSPYFAREKDKEKDRDRDHKSESSRDKDVDRDKEKSANKDKDRDAKDSKVKEHVKEEEKSTATSSKANDEKEKTKEKEKEKEKDKEKNVEKSESKEKDKIVDKSEVKDKTKEKDVEKSETKDKKKNVENSETKDTESIKSK